MNDTLDLETLAHQLIDDQQLETERLFIESAGVRLCLRSNSSELIKKLRGYFLHVLAEAGEENAGLVDIGDGLACCFKIESHNHPSAIEPYQGAATGVGGINRDIFSMGARPIAQLNSLRFGNIGTDRTKWLLKGVVKGIGDYGNSFGIPTVGGEVYFDDVYETVYVKAIFYSLSFLERKLQ